MRAFSLIMLLLGAGVLAVLVASIGISPIESALAPVGWGIVPIVAVHAFPLLLDVVAWRLLFPSPAPSLAALTGARWIGEGFNNLLPVMQIGGDMVRARVAIFAGASTATATASVIADVTIGTLTQVVFTLVGVTLLAVHNDTTATLPVVMSALALGAAVLVFYRLQRGGLVLFWRLLERVPMGVGWVARLGKVEPFHDALNAVYVDGARVAQSFAWRLAGWFAGVFEIAAALYFLGHPPRWIDALIFESLGQAGRAAAFPIPAGLGAMEASFVGVGLLLGYDPTTCIALALVRRGRDIILGVPALAAYWLAESRRAARSG
jgi:putative membrane protein